jgi:hypothetical protein
VAPGHFQLETGVVQYEGSRGQALPETVRLRDFLLKLGLYRGLDFELGFRFLALTRPAGARASEAFAVDTGRSLLLRSEIRVLRVRDGLFALAVAPVLTVPVRPGRGVEAGGQIFMALEVPRIFDVEFDVSFLALLEADERHYHFVLPITIAITRQLYGPLSAFVEFYTESDFAQPFAFRATFDTGLVLRLGRFVQLDLATYIGVTRNVPLYALTFGCSFVI